MKAHDKATIIAMLYTWISQRPGLEFGNYGDVANYRSEMRRITRQLHDARQLLRSVELSSITGDELAAAFPRAYSGRLRLEKREDGKHVLDYCTGQYWPTEYRAAACAVLASALWAHKRDRCMPEPSYVVGGNQEFPTRDAAIAYAESKAPEYILGVEERYKGKTAGDWIRTSFRREYGRSIQARWFD